MVNNDYIVIVTGTNDINYMNNNFIAQEINTKIKNVSHSNVIIAAVPYRYDEYKNITKVNNSMRQETI